MKELTIEQKAQAYDKVVNKLKGFMAQGVDPLITRADVQDFFPELSEPEDERIRKVLVDYFKSYKEQKECGIKTFYGIPTDNILAWLEKQGEHANFRNNIQIGDKVTRNEDGVLVNLSQLNRVAKKQGEQKPTWSEEDEHCRLQLIVFCENCMVQDSDAKKCANWLKSLRPQSQWKPSDQELGAILAAIGDERQKGSDVAKELLKIYQQLKKL